MPALHAGNNRLSARQVDMKRRGAQRLGGHHESLGVLGFLVAGAQHGEDFALVHLAQFEFPPEKRKKICVHVQLPPYPRYALRTVSFSISSDALPSIATDPVLST